MASFRELFLSLFTLALMGCTQGEELWSERSGGVLGGFTNLCASEDPKNVSVSCHGVRIVRRVVQQFLDKSAAIPTLDISEGLRLVESSAPGAPRRARNMKNFGVVSQVVNFLEGRELRVKLPSLLPDNFESALKETLPSVNEGRGKGGGGLGGGGSKGGGGGVMMMALMMGKMMGALGLGALGLLAMKALMVSGLALMLSLIVAAKKLSGGHDDGGGHHVIYAQESHGHGHRRSLDDTNFTDLPYRGYALDYAVQNS